MAKLEDISIESSETARKRIKTEKKQNKNIQGLWESYRRYNIQAVGIPEVKEREKGKEEISDTIMTEFPPN